MNFYKNKTILVTGSCGTVGSELINQLLKNNSLGIKKVIGIDINESLIFFQDQKFENNKKANFYVIDIKNEEHLINLFDGVDIVFHCAAYKHVAICEKTPEQAVETNIRGIQNVINTAIKKNIKRVVFTSSDKAVNPTNVMGSTKLLGERLITAANANKTKKYPIFISTRFGNIMGSNGSVIEVFKKQILRGGPVTLTDSEMSRFVMTTEESVKLILDSAIIGKGGEVFITKMPVIMIKDLALSMIEIYSKKFGYKTKDVKIKIIGSKPGEKLYEELMNTEETRRALELNKYFSVLPALRYDHKNLYTYRNVKSLKIQNPYISSKQKPLSINQIKKILNKMKIF
jgi:FlaA1/EpsC-like NDP-sugar epimerase